MWNVSVRVPRSTEADVAKYNLFLDGVMVGEVMQPATGDAAFSYQIPEDGQYSLTATVVDQAGHESQPSDPLVATLDHLAPAAPARLVLVAATWVP